MTILLRWADIRDPDLDCYEVRRGNGWMLNHVVYRGRSPECQVDEQLGAETYHVRARNRAGRFSERGTKIVVTTAVPNGWTGGFSRNEKALGWPGTKTNVSVNTAGYLELDEGSWQGLYETPVIDAGGRHEHRWTAISDALLQDLATTGASLTAPVNSTAIRQRTGEGLEPSPETALGLDLETQGDGLTAPAEQLVGLLGRGPASGLGVFGLAKLEASFSDNASPETFGEWIPMRPITRWARYVRFRLRLRRASPTDYQVQVRELLTAAIFNADMMFAQQEHEQRERLVSIGGPLTAPEELGESSMPTIEHQVFGDGAMAMSPWEYAVTPHGQYFVTPPELAVALAEHRADPHAHPGLQARSERNQPNGYAGLNAAAQLDSDRIPYLSTSVFGD